MKFILRPDEEAALKLRALYEEHGYDFYRMSRFEEYDFYAGKKDFLTSKNILTFTDKDGKLMALRPDVTLSIIKHMKFDNNDIQKFYYDEKVYRVPKNSNKFKEISQVGIEYAATSDRANIREVIELALLSLETIAGGRRFILDVADASIIANLIPESQNPDEILKLISEKNIHGLKKINASKELIELIEIHQGGQTRPTRLTELIEGLENVQIDYSCVNNLNYYNGIVFRGFIEGIPESILSGGQYDNLMHSMGHKNSTAIGFALYLNLIERHGVVSD